MKKLSPAQERVLRQVAAGQITLVSKGGSALNVWERDAIDMTGRRVNRQYDVLITRKLIAQGGGVLKSEDVRPVGITQAGYDMLSWIGLPGKFIFQDTQRGTGAVWMIRKLTGGERMSYLLFKDGEIYDRFDRAESVYTVFRSFCPWDYNFEGDMGL